MALTTPISSVSCVRPRAMYGKDIPEGVLHAEIVDDHLRAERVLRWITSDGQKHSIPFEATNEGITAAIVAMKLTC